MSRQVGLRDIYFAELTKDDATGVTYSTPIKLERGINAKISPKSNSEKLYSDDAVEDIINTFDSVDVEIELNQLSIDSRAKLQGSTVVSGTLLENKDDIAPFGALGFRSKKVNGKYRYVWLYKGKFELASDEYATEEDKPKTQSAKIKGTFVARDNDGNWRLILDEDEVGVSTTLIQNWFTAVQEQPTV